MVNILGLTPAPFFWKTIFLVSLAVLNVALPRANWAVVFSIYAGVTLNVQLPLMLAAFKAATAVANVKLVQSVPATVAAVKAVVGAALTVKFVPAVIAVTMVLAANAPVPAITDTTSPTCKVPGLLLINVVASGNATPVAILAPMV